MITKLFLEFNRRDILKSVDKKFIHHGKYTKDLRDKLGKISLKSKNWFLDSFLGGTLTFKIRSSKGDKYYNNVVSFIDNYQWLRENFKFKEYDLDTEKGKERIVRDVRYYFRAMIDHGDILCNCNCPSNCLHGNTKIKLLNGRILTVEELSKFKDYNDVLVYSVDKNGNLRFGKVNNVWISGYENKLIKIILDNYKEIITTLNHRYMIVDGSYKEANELKKDDLLMSLYFEYEHLYNFIEKSHKIKNIEYIILDEKIPVYDISVEGYNNFYIDAGIILHNSYWGYKYQATQLDYVTKKNKENRFPIIRNPGLRGAVCKHLAITLGAIADNKIKPFIVDMLTQRFFETEVRRRYKTLQPSWWLKYLRRI